MENTQPSTSKVYAAISAVSAALAENGIAKTRTNPKYGYSFRGIDDLYMALAPLLAKHHLIIISRYLSRAVTEQASQVGTKIFHVALEAKFDLICTLDGSKLTARGFGEGMDTQDKATGKAMSSAYKTMCLQLFCIPTEGNNDIENDDYESAAQPISETSPAPAPRPPGQASPKPQRTALTPDEAEEAERRIDQAFADRGISQVQARSIKIGLLQARKFAGVKDADRDFLERMIVNIGRGIYDGQKNGRGANGSAQTQRV